jgi:hypothetical protein
MQRSECQIGTKVYFGRENGQRTLGEIVKLNPTKAKVKILEARGSSSQAGSLWGVPYSMLTPADENVVVAGRPISVQLPPKELTYSPFDHINNLILEAILSCYSGLSPENLTADGERPMAQVRSLRTRLERQLRGLVAAYGGPVTEEEVYGWAGSKSAYNNNKRYGPGWKQG